MTRPRQPAEAEMRNAPGEDGIREANGVRFVDAAGNLKLPPSTEPQVLYRAK